MSRGMQRLNRMAGRVKRGLRAAGRAAMFVGRQAARVARVGLFAMAGAATAVLVGVTKLAGGMDELAKTTRAVDFDIEKFQEFKFVAEQTGVSGEKFGSIVKKFSATVGEFKGGYGTMFTALKRINPQLAKQLKQTSSTSEAFELYLSAIQKAPNALQKSALASAAFGKRMGIDMINMANLSTEELDKLRKQMRANGVVTAEQAAKAEAFNDATNRLKLTAKGLAVDALTPLMPLLEKGADKIRDWIIENRGLISQKVHMVFSRIMEFGKKAFTWLKNNVPPLIDQLVRIGKDGFAWIRDNKKDLQDFGRLILDVGKTVVKVAGFVVKNKESVLALIIAYKTLGVSMAAMNWAGMVTGAGNAGQAVTGLQGKVKGLSGMLGKGGLLVTSFAAGWAVGSAIFKQWDSAMDNLLTKTTNVASQIGLNVHKMERTQLDTELSKLEKEREDKLGFWTGARAFFTGRMDEYKEAIATNNQAQADIMNEQTRRIKAYNEDLKKFITGKGPRPVAFEQQMLKKPALSVAENLPPGMTGPLLVDASKEKQIAKPSPVAQRNQPSSMFTPGDTRELPAAPQAQVSHTETVKKEVVEIRIRDDKNRAEVSRTGDTVGGLTLATSGGM
jgi:hypothetical protein